MKKTEELGSYIVLSYIFTVVIAFVATFYTKNDFSIVEGYTKNVYAYNFINIFTFSACWFAVAILLFLCIFFTYIWMKKQLSKKDGEEDV